MIVCENKGVWPGRDFTFDFIPQTLMSCGSRPPSTTTRKQTVDGVEREDGVWQQQQDPGCAAAESAEHERHHNRMRTSDSDRCSLCLGVCGSGWEQLWLTQRAVGQQSMYTNTHRGATLQIHV